MERSQGIAREGSSRYFHQTAEALLQSIVQSGFLSPSMASQDPKDLHKEEGWCLADLPPGSGKHAQLSRVFVRIPFWSGKFTSGSADEHLAFGGTGLGLEPVPPVEEIAREPEFVPSLIATEEFESKWPAAWSQINQQSIRANT